MGDKPPQDFHIDPEIEEALSLCDLPLNADDNNLDYFTNCDGRSYSSEPPQFFEFFSDRRSDMSPADDLIFCGKLVPFKNNFPSHDNHHPATHQIQKNTFRRRSESLSELQPARSDSTKTRQIMKNSRSLDQGKLRRSSSTSESRINRNSSFRKSDSSKVSKTRWYVFMFGLVKFPPEMELRDIKSRQVRRSQTSLFPSVESIGKGSVKRGGGKGTWGLLKALSCKDHANAAVIGCIST